MAHFRVSISIRQILYRAT